MRTLYSRFKDTETRNAAGIEFDDPQVSGQRGDGEGWRSLKSREDTQEIQSYVLGGERIMGDWTLSSQVGYSQSTEKDPGGIAAAKFVGDFTDVGFDGTRKPTPLAGADFYDRASFTLR